MGLRFCSPFWRPPCPLEISNAFLHPICHLPEFLDLAVFLSLPLGDHFWDLVVFSEMGHWETNLGLSHIFESGHWETTATYPNFLDLVVFLSLPLGEHFGT